MTPPLSPNAHDKFLTMSVSLQPSDSPKKESVPTRLSAPAIQVDKPFIPQFYFPKGKPVDTTQEDRDLKAIVEAFPGDSIRASEFGRVVKVIGLPHCYSSRVFSRIAGDTAITMSKAQFMRFWKAELSGKNSEVRFFNLSKQPGSPGITREDFKPLMKVLLETHPGLEFLKATPEFQERYMDTVVERIFYCVDLNDDGYISLRELRRSSLVKVWQSLDDEEDINKIREYFSYEHFYVLYCRFWELDTDHDFVVDKEDFSRYEGHALSRKAIDRIFEGVPREFKTKQIGKMGFDDFIWFMLSEEDKTSPRAIEYWFKVVDLDNNGLITGHEMQFFYEEQLHRLEYLNQESVTFSDVMCQMTDMLQPTVPNTFTLDDFKRNRQLASTFFNALVSLNKFIAYEQRDPFTQKHELNENPDYNDWDRFAMSEYVRLAMEEENAEQSEMMDDVWDSDHEDGQ